MTIKATYSCARANLAALWDQVEDGREPVILERRGHEDLALIPAAELASVQETAHLLSSPENAARLVSALARSRRRTTPPVELETLMKDLGLSA